MIILLLTLLAIALTVTIAGLFLTYRAYAPELPRNWAGSRARVEQPLEMYKWVSMYRSRRRGRGGNWARMWMLLDVRNLFVVRAGVETPWLGITLILGAVFLSGSLFLQSLMPSTAVLFDSSTAGLPMMAKIPEHVSAVKVVQQQQQQQKKVVNASKALVRIGQLYRDQYNTQQEYDTWAYAACSAAAMAEVINAYGHKYRVIDILNIEYGVGEITPELGLIEPTGIDKTVAKFGFKTTWMGEPSTEQVIQMANSGKPVIVAWPPDRWDGGHVLVVRGGDSDNVYLADSSNYNFEVLPRYIFEQRWLNTFSAVIEPK